LKLKPVSPTALKPVSPTALKPVSPTALKPVSPTALKPLLPSTCNMYKKTFHEVLVITTVTAHKFIEWSLSQNTSSFLKKVNYYSNNNKTA
jgi:hypothetical protein